MKPRRKRSAKRDGLKRLDGMEVLDSIDALLGETTWEASHHEESDAGVKLRQRIAGVSGAVALRGGDANTLAQIRDLVRCAQLVGYERGALEARELLYGQFCALAGFDDPEDRS